LKACGGVAGTQDIIEPVLSDIAESPASIAYPLDGPVVIQSEPE
jgi:hypothetical protein